MTSRIDSKRDALLRQGFTGAIPEMTLAWLQFAGATSDHLADAWLEMLAIQGFEGQRNDAWYAFLGDRGYVGAIADREAAFWNDGGSLEPPVPQGDWTVGQLGNLYGYGPGYGGLVPDSNGTVTILRLDVDSVTNIVTLEFDAAPPWPTIFIGAENIGITLVSAVGPDTLYQVTDPIFTAAVVAELGNTNVVAALPGDAVQPPIWETSIPDSSGDAGVEFNYDTSQHLEFNPFFQPTGFAISSGATAGASISSAGVLTLADTVVAGEYPFTIVATNLAGDSAPSNVFTVSLLADPIIDTQPEDAAVLIGENALFSVVASHPAGADLFYDWVVFPPANTSQTDQPELTIFDCQESQSGTQVHCVVTAYSPVSGYKVSTDTVTLTVTAEPQFPPVIDIQPEPVTLIAPEGGSFFVLASHPTDATLYYQWQVADLVEQVWVDAGDVLDINGDDVRSFLPLASSSVDDHDSYVSCLVRAYDPDSSAYEVRSDPVLLSVYSVPQTDPVIVVQPEDASPTVPDGTTFTVVATHPDENVQLFYEWDHQFIDVDAASELTPTLILNSTTLQEDGLPTRCRVRAYENTTEYQVYSDTVQLNAIDGREAPDIDTQPEPLVVVEPDGGTFTVVASHPQGADIFYQWECKSASSPADWVPAGDSNDGLSDVSGEFTATMTVNSTEFADDRPVRVRVYAYELGGQFVTASDEVYLEVEPDNEQPVWDFVPDDGFPLSGLPEQIDMNQYILAGFELEGWALNGNPAGVTIDAAGLATIANTVPLSTFAMTCYVENIVGSDISNEFTWQVTGPPVIDTQPQALVAIEPAGGTFTVAASHADPDVDLAYRWEAFDGTWQGAGSVLSDSSGSSTPTLTIGSTVQSDNVDVRCRIRPYSGSLFQVFTNEVALTVNRVPATIDQQPSNATVTEGDPASFMVEASHPSGAPLFYSWQDSFVSPVSGRSSPNLNVLGADINDDGEQTQCRIRAYENTGDNQVTSSLATLNVDSALNPPDWSTIPNQTTEVLDMPATFNANDYVFSGETISAWSTVLGATSVNSSGIVSLPRRSVGNVNNDAVNATNSAGTEQSNSFNWSVNPSVVLSDDFDYANGPLEGNGPWLVIPRGDDVSHTVVGGVLQAQGLAIDVSDIVPAGDYELFATITVTPNQIIPGLEDNYLVGLSTIVDGNVDQGVIWQAIPDHVEWLDTVSEGGFVLNESPVAGDEYGIRRVGNNVECIKNGSVKGSFTAGTQTQGAVAVLISFPLGNTVTMGYSNATFTIIG